MLNTIHLKSSYGQVVFLLGYNIKNTFYSLTDSLLFLQTERKRGGSPVEEPGVDGVAADGETPNRNSHELSCANCGNSQCSHTNATNNCTNGEVIFISL